MVSFAGDWFLIVALSGLVLRLTHSPALVAAVFVAYNPPYGIVSFIGGRSAQWALVTFSYQSTVPDRVLGRVFSFDGALITFSLAASNALCGWLAGFWSVRPVRAFVGVSVCV